MTQARPAFYNARGAGDQLGVTAERARQLFRAGKLPVTALLNGRIPLVDEAALRALAEERRRQRAG